MEARVRSGHPWVFAASIRDQNREGEPGELAIIYDRNNSFLAAGLYDPASPLRVRVVHCGKPVTINTDWWRNRIRTAARKRAGIFDDQTNAGRWINGESDQLPALVLDRYDGSLVVKLYSGVWFDRVQEISSLIAEEFAPERLVLRLSRNIQVEAEGHGLEDGQLLFGSELFGPVQFLETGLRFEADPLKGQKTGFFLDQRENRRGVEALAAGRDVLNAFSYSGGFSLYAARGGARSVTDVDISSHALESSRRNFSLNPHPQIQRAKHILVQADVFEWLQSAHQAQYDLIVLDPPSLARRKEEKPGALNAYANLAQSGIRLARRSGIVVCCSCSAHVRADEFFATVTTAAKRSRREFNILRRTLEPIDHHAGFPEAQYLKAIYLRLDR